VLVLATIAIGCGSAARSSPGTCRIPAYVPAGAAGPARADLGPLRPYRNYYAIADLSPPAHLYTVWYRDVEPTVVNLRVTDDGDGAIRVEQTGGWWGARGVGPTTTPPPPPPELAHLTRAVTDATRACGGDVVIAYLGERRVVRVHELIKHGHDVGWYATAALAVDAALTRVEGTFAQESAFGQIEVPAGARWVDFTPPPGRIGHTLVLASPTEAWTAALLAAARELDAGAPGPPVDSLVPPDDTAFLPPGFAQKVAVEVTIYGRARNFSDQQGGKYRVAVPVADAVFAGTGTGARTIRVGDHPFRIAATLTTTPRDPDPQRTRADFAGTLAITVDGGPRHRFRRSYPAAGPIELEDGAVVAPTGFVLPGGSAPSPEADRLHARLPGDDQFEAFDVYVGVSVHGDPRE
jgi:hypothetical protein